VDQERGLAMKLQTWTGCALIAVFATAPQPAYAYLDPGTGSMILQLLLGGTVGALAVGKLYWFKIKSMFSFSGKKDDVQTKNKTPDGE
jgi:hypothetical protein